MPAASTSNPTRSSPKTNASNTSLSSPSNSTHDPHLSFYFPPAFTRLERRDTLSLPCPSPPLAFSFRGSISNVLVRVSRAFTYALRCNVTAGNNASRPAVSQETVPVHAPITTLVIGPKASDVGPQILSLTSCRLSLYKPPLAALSTHTVASSRLLKEESSSPTEAS